MVLPGWQQPSAARSTACSNHVPQTIAPSVVSVPLPRLVQGQRLRKSRPWSEVKSRRGAPKRIPTEGFACPNPKCSYFANTDAQVHALVGDGKHGQAERIQTFRCQACRATFSARLNTPLYCLKTPSQQVAVVLSALAEGLDPSAAARVFCFRQATITTWLTRAGENAQVLHEHSFCHL
jgi:transposase-like protein